MRQRDALGRSGGAAGELDVDRHRRTAASCPAPPAPRDGARRPCRRPRRRRWCRAARGPPIWITARSCRQPRRAAARPAARSPAPAAACSASPCSSLVLNAVAVTIAAQPTLCQREFEFAEAIGRIDGDQDQSRPWRRRTASASIPAGSATTPRSARRARGRARESRRPAHRPARPVRVQVHLTSWLGDTSASRSAQRRAADRDCGRWCRPATAHRRCRTHSSPQSRSRIRLHRRDRSRF